MNAITDISTISRDAVNYFYTLIEFATIANAKKYDDGSSFIDIQIDDDNIQINFDSDDCVESATYFIDGGNYEYPLEVTEENNLAKEALAIIEGIAG